MEHTKRCLEQMAKDKKDLEEFEKKWPNYCRTCEAVGGSIQYGVRYYKDGSGEPDSFEPCPSCQKTETPKCPRCGETWDEERMTDLLPCPKCHWNWGFETLFDDFAPAKWECECGEPEE